MQIPQEYRPFEGNNMILVADHVQALFYLVSGNQIELLHKLEPDAEELSDREAYSKHTGSQGGSPERPDIKDHLTKDHLFGIIGQDLQKHINQDDFDNLYVFAPEDIFKEIINSLPTEVKEKVVDSFPQNVIKDTPIEIIARIRKPKF